MYKTTVVVDGMHCSMCESQVKSLVMKILPDAKLSASHRKGTLTVEGSFIPSGICLETCFCLSTLWGLWTMVREQNEKPKKEICL